MSHHGGAVTSPPWGPEQLPPQWWGMTPAAIQPQSPPARPAQQSGGQEGSAGRPSGVFVILCPLTPSLSATLGGGVLLGTLVVSQSLTGSALNPGHLCPIHLTLRACLPVSASLSLHRLLCCSKRLSCVRLYPSSLHLPTTLRLARWPNQSPPVVTSFSASLHMFNKNQQDQQWFARLESRLCASHD